MRDSIITELRPIKKWSIVPDQIRHLTCKQKSFVVLCAEGLVPRIGEDELMIIVKIRGDKLAALG